MCVYVGVLRMSSTVEGVDALARSWDQMSKATCACVRVCTCVCVFMYVCMCECVFMWAYCARPVRLRGWMR